jgi:hypothetical protein
VCAQGSSTPLAAAEEAPAAGRAAGASGILEPILDDLVDDGGGVEGLHLDSSARDLLGRHRRYV